MTKNLIKQILDNPEHSVKDQALIKKAYDFAAKAHAGQKRKSGDDFIVHPISVAHYLSQIKMDAATIAAALLHDVLEDTYVTQQALKKEFSDEICFLVEGVSQLKKLKHLSRKELEHEQNQRLRKMFLAMAQDIRVVLIKLADRRHNLQTLEFLNQTIKKRKAFETIHIYSPVAARLGMGELKGELEDLAFPHAFPGEYKELMGKVKEKYREREKYLTRVKNTMEKRLRKNGIVPIDIHSRAKHYYSLYKKMIQENLDAQNVYDLVAIRIILENTDQCYETMGIIHKLWRPVPGYVKDFIALPKSNGYQSLHTTVFCERGKIVEFQIRTPDMHHHAENGVAAHWAYSEAGKPEGSVVADHKELNWINKLREWQSRSPNEFVESLKIDYLSERIFVFTPKGDVKDLPAGSTPIDFAYQVHSEIGDRIASAKVDGKIVPIRQELKTGQVVEIITSKNASPSRDWLKFTKTAEAKRKIRAFSRMTG